MGGARLGDLLLEGKVGHARLARDLQGGALQCMHCDERIARVVVDGKADVGRARRHGSGRKRVSRGEKCRPRANIEAHILFFEISNFPPTAIFRSV